LGDNSLDSNDSRYWGFIPEDFIIGIVTKIVR
jgi:signal peptidase I